MRITAACPKQLQSDANQLVFSDTALIATPDTLTACLGDNGLRTIGLMGLTSVLQKAFLNDMIL
jgi:hypothetical protein